MTILPRQLVVCCDGTNNTLTGGAEDTNVLRLYEHLHRHAPPDTASVERLLYYDPGVGTPDMVPPTGLIDWVSRSWDRLSGLASGRGVYDNIEQAYAFLMRNWRDENDKIFLFGFSRGAFTVRAVAGMVHLFGILKPEHEQLLPTLIHIYFSLPEEARGPMQKATRWLHRSVGGAQPKEAPKSPRDALAAQVRSEFTSEAGAKAWVHWVGVWDTVESVGLPGPMSRMNPSVATLRNKRVRNVRHALSFDEHRWTFKPRLYEEPDDIEGPDHTLKQRWFPGVHCDAGGSYPKDECGFSDAALGWMVEEVAAALEVPPLPPSKAEYVRHDALWDTPWWALAGMTLRNMQPQVPAPGSPGDTVPMKIIAAQLPAGQARSVWHERRPLWPLLVAMLLGTLSLVFSGWSLLPGLHLEDGLANIWFQSTTAARSFADDQLASLWLQGLLAPGHAPWLRPGQPGWAMFWDMGFLLGWGYLLARISSRSFAWMAGMRSPTSSLPFWRWLGMAPLLAAGGDVVENLLTLSALAAHAMGTDMVARGLLFLTGAASLAKLAGLVACVPLGVMRYWMIFRPNHELDDVNVGREKSATHKLRRSRHRASDLYAAFGVAVLALLVWTFARLGTCWGSYGAMGAMTCRGHYLVGVMIVVGVAVFVALAIGLGELHQERFEGQKFKRMKASWHGYRQLEGSYSLHVSASSVLMLLLLMLCLWIIVLSPVRF